MHITTVFLYMSRARAPADTARALNSEHRPIATHKSPPSVAQRRRHAPLTARKSHCSAALTKEAASSSTSAGPRRVAAARTCARSWSAAIAEIGV